MPAEKVKWWGSAQEVVLEGFKREALRQQGLSLLFLQAQVPRVSTVPRASWRAPTASSSPGPTASVLGLQSLPPKPRGPSHVVSSHGPPQGAELMRNWFPQPPRSKALETATPETWSPRRPKPLLGDQEPTTEAAVSGHRSPPHMPPPGPPALECPDLPKQRCFSPCASEPPHFRQTCACFPPAWAHLGLPPQAPPCPRDKPRIVFMDLINDNTPPPPATNSTSPPGSPFPAKVSLVLRVALPQPKNRSLMSSGESSLPGEVPPLCSLSGEGPIQGPASAGAFLARPARHPAWRCRECAEVEMNSTGDNTGGCSVRFPKHGFHRQGSPQAPETVSGERGRSGSKAGTD